MAAIQNAIGSRLRTTHPAQGCLQGVNEGHRTTRPGAMGPVFYEGINLGLGLPGYYPGEYP